MLWDRLTGADAIDPAQSATSPSALGAGGELAAQQVARASGIHFNTLARIERAELSNRIELRVLDEICRALECQPGDILVWVDDSKAESKRKAKGK